MLPLRLLEPTDVPAAIRLSRAAGWNQTEADWVQLIEYQPTGCFGLERDGKLISTVTTTCYGNELAWIGMMLVDADHRRQGIATEMMRKALGDLRHRGVQTIKLDATAAGAAVYEKLGFRAECEFHRWHRQATEKPSRAGEVLDVAEPSCLSDSLLKRDRDAFAADRSVWLHRLAKRSHCVATAGGFGLCRPGEQAAYIGPIVASDQRDGERIAIALASRCSRAETYWDVFDRRAESWAESLGFVPGRGFIRMFYGEPKAASGRSRQYAIGDPSTG